MNLRRWWKSRCVEADPLAQPGEVLGDGAGLPRHRAVGRVGEQVGVVERASRRPGAARCSMNSTCWRAASPASPRRGRRAGPAVLRRDLPQRLAGSLTMLRRHGQHAALPVDVSPAAEGAELGPAQPGGRGDEDGPGVLGAARLLGRVDQRRHLARASGTTGVGVRDRRRVGPLRRVGVPPAPPAGLGEHRREAGVDLVDAARRQAAVLVGAVEVGEHLRRHLRSPAWCRARPGCCGGRPARSRGWCSASGPCGAARRSSRRTARRPWRRCRCGGPCPPRRAARPGPSSRRAGCRGTPG